MTAQATTSTSPATASAPARVVPTVSQPVRIPWNDWLEQFLVHETPLLEKAAQAGVNMGAAAIPGGVGSILVQLLGPGIVKQVADGVLATIEGPLANPNIAIEIPSTDTVAAMVGNAVNTLAPTFASSAGGLLDGWISAAVGALKPKSTT